MRNTAGVPLGGEATENVDSAGGAADDSAAADLAETEWYRQNQGSGTGATAPEFPVVEQESLSADSLVLTGMGMPNSSAHRKRVT